MESKGDPDLLKIAEESGCHLAGLVIHSERQNWVRDRASLDSQRAVLATNNRAITAAKVDAEAVTEYSRFFSKLTAKLHELTDVVCALPLNDPDPRIRAQQAAKGLELTNETIKGLAGLVETGRAIGLILGAKTLPGSDAGKLDFAKLTTLNLTLIQAQKEAGVKPVEVMELDEPSK